MADDLKPTPDPATPPAEDEGDDKWRNEFFKAKSEKEDLAKKVGTLTTEVTALKDQATGVQESGVELLRIKKAYAAGVPQHLLNLVTASDEAEIDSQIKTIMEQLTPAPSAPAPVASDGNGVPDPQVAAVVAPVGTVAPIMPIPPPPSGKPGESDLDKYMKATPEEQMEMMRKWKDTPGWTLT